MKIATRPRPVIAVAAVSYVVALLLIALWPEHVDSDVSVVDWWPTRELADLFDLTPWQAYDWIERTANVVLFVPFGWFLTVLLTGSRWWAALLLGLGTACSIELVQNALIDGRTGAGSDIVTNTLGAALGAGLGLLYHRRHRDVT